MDTSRRVDLRIIDSEVSGVPEGKLVLGRIVDATPQARCESLGYSLTRDELDVVYQRLPR